MFIFFNQHLPITLNPKPLKTNILVSISTILAFSDTTYKGYHMVFVFICPTYFTKHNAFKVHPC